MWSCFGFIFGSDYYVPLLDASKIKEEWPYFKMMLLHNFELPKDKNKDIFQEIFLCHKENYLNVLELATIAMLGGFSTKNIIKNKFRICLKTEMIDRLPRVGLNWDMLDIDKAMNAFIVKKQNTFKTQNSTS